MKDKFIDLILNNQTLFGFLFIVLAIVFLIANLNNNKSFNEFNIATWKSYVNSWALVVILIILGLFLIF